MSVCETESENVNPTDTLLSFVFFSGTRGKGNLRVEISTIYSGVPKEKAAVPFAPRPVHEGGNGKVPRPTRVELHRGPSERTTVVGGSAFWVVTTKITFCWGLGVLVDFEGDTYNDPNVDTAALPSTVGHPSPTYVVPTSTTPSTTDKVSTEGKDVSPCLCLVSTKGVVNESH